MINEVCFSRRFSRLARSASTFVPILGRDPIPRSVIMMASAREDLVREAREQRRAEKWDDMCETMKEAVQLASRREQTPVTGEERTLISIAYERAADARRTRWFELDTNSNPGQCARQRKKLSAELTQICEDMLAILETYLLPECQTNEYRVFFLKEKGDFYRYLAEVAEADGKDALAKHAENAYRNAMCLAIKSLPATHHTRLGLAINYGVLLFDVMACQQEACAVARYSLDESESLEMITRASELIISRLSWANRQSIAGRKHLKRNLALWARETSV